MGQTSTPRLPRESSAAPRPPSPSSTTPRRRPGKPPRRSNARRIVALVFFAAVGLGVGFVAGNKTIRKYGVPWLRQHTPFVSQTPQQLFGKSTINVMIIGHDYDYTDRDQIIRNTNGRSDMLMVAHLDFANPSATLLSIPRDTRAVIPGRGVHKINAANEFGGAPLAERTVVDNFGIASDHYITVDFDGFQKAIDKLGGVDLVVDRKMDYDDNWGHLHIHLKPGMQHLDGQEAMGFVRFRHADSDFVRVKRQQTLLAALKGKLSDPTALAQIPAILDILDRHIQSDLDPEQRICLADFLHGLPKDKLRMDTLPSLDNSRGTLIRTDWAKAAPMIQSIFGTTPPDSSTVDPGRHGRHGRYRR